MVTWLRDPLVRLLTVFVAPGLFALVALWRIWNTPGGEDEEEGPDARAHTVPIA
jgi:hypothetical protein